MRRWAPLIAGLALTACGGGSGSGSTPLPSPIASLIQQINSEPPANRPAYVASYQYQGQVVYYVPPRCCDIFGELYDASGNLMCHPDGGLAGHGDGRCPDFLRERTDKTIIWHDPSPAATTASRE